MVESYRNLFDKQSQAYSQFRPKYPAELMDFIVSHVGSKKQAWDVGCGSGQASIMLAEHFDQVIASDASQAQLAQATVHERVNYKIASAEESGIKDQSCDLITVANAVHWFDRELFYKEVRRVLKSDGAIAVWCNGWLEVPEEIEGRIADFYKYLEPHWAAPLKLVYDHYKTLDFPFEELEVPEFALKESWTLERILGFYATWSGVQACKEKTGIDPVSILAENLKPMNLGNTVFEIKLPLHIRVGRLN